MCLRKSEAVQRPYEAQGLCLVKNMSNNGMDMVEYYKKKQEKTDQIIHH